MLVRIASLVIGDLHREVLFMKSVACVTVYPGDAPALSIQRAMHNSTTVLYFVSVAGLGWPLSVAWTGRTELTNRRYSYRTGA